MRLCLGISICALAITACGPSFSQPARVTIANPYENVDWRTFSHYRADLHVHTLQSDGCHPLSEVVKAFHDLGFAILSITDHDMMAPNFCPLRDAASQSQIAFGAYATERTPYPDPRPATFPADTTWPWRAYGAPAPSDLGMLGIEGAELTCTYHVNSFFSDYGVREPCNKNGLLLDEELVEVARRGGLAVLNHPDTSQPPEWFAKLYREHSGESFVGIEIASDEPAAADSYVVLWDQLLGELMPSRPIWGFGTSDTHILARTRFAFTVFLLHDVTTDSVKDAMRRGQFYSVVQPKMLNLSRDRGIAFAGREAYDGKYPDLRSIVVDRDARRITIDAAGYDEIVWISRRSSSDSNPWPHGEVIQRGSVFDFSQLDSTWSYVRAEVIRHTDEGPVRLMLNPFALTSR
jgi:predicted metal-dependent phosphoesterase TrpH